MTLASDFEESNSSEQHLIADTATTDGLKSRNLESGRIKYVVSVILIYYQTWIYQSDSDWTSEATEFF